MKVLRENFLFELFFQEIDKRLNLENEKRQKFMASFDNKKKIEEKFDDFNRNEEYFFFLTIEIIQKIERNFILLHYRRKNPETKRLARD